MSSRELDRHHGLGATPQKFYAIGMEIYRDFSIFQNLFLQFSNV